MAIVMLRPQPKHLRVTNEETLRPRGHPRLRVTKATCEPSDPLAGASMCATRPPKSGRGFRSSGGGALLCE